MHAYATPLQNPNYKNEVTTDSVEKIIQNLSILLSSEPLLSFQIMLKGQLINLSKQTFFNSRVESDIEKILINSLQKSCDFLTKNKQAHGLISTDKESPLGSHSCTEIIVLPNAHEYRLEEIEYNFEKTLYFALSLSQQLTDCFTLIEQKKGMKPERFYTQLCEQINQFYTAVFHFITPQERAEVWTPLIHYLSQIHKNKTPQQ